MNTNEVVIIGGGLAGLTSAIDLALRGKQVVVIEKNTYPHHKVCGEYVSNEVRPYLAHLGLNIEEWTRVEISSLQLGTNTGKSFEVDLPLGGFGISRFVLDHQLYLLAKARGVSFLFDTVHNIQFSENEFTISLTSNEAIHAKVVLGAFGKRSNLDKKLNRPFIFKKSSWLAIKAHYNNYDFSDDVVSLQTFPGGYGGLSKTEEGNINFCYLVKYDQFKKSKSLNEFEQEVLAQNKVLDHFLKHATPVFEKPMSIAQISFDKKAVIENHILMCGDTAGLIHPLCGNGMAMAIHSAKIASYYVNQFIEDPKFTRNAMERAYRKAWTREFRKRMKMGRFLQAIMLHTNWFDFLLSTIASSKMLMRNIITGTHGKPIVQ